MKQKKHDEIYRKQLTRAVIAGVVAFLVTVPLLLLERYKYVRGLTPFQVGVALVLNVFFIVALIIFLRGYRSVALREKNALLQKSCSFLIWMNCILVAYSLLMLVIPSAEKTSLLTLEIFVAGIATIFFGVALFRLHHSRTLAKSASIVNVALGIAFILLIPFPLFSLIGLFLALVSSALEIVLLWRYRAFSVS